MLLDVRTVCSFDPGLATGAGVLFGVRPERVLDVIRLKTPKMTAARHRPGDMSFSDAVLRARAQAELMVQFVIKHEPDLVCCESFVDLASRKGKEDKLRWTTPLVIGHFDARMVQLGYTGPRLRYQNPVVLHQLRDERAMLIDANSAPGKRKEHVLVPGDELITNEHLISAYLHGSWTIERLDAEQLAPDCA